MHAATWSGETSGCRSPRDSHHARRLPHRSPVRRPRPHVRDPPPRGIPGTALRGPRRPSTLRTTVSRPPFVTTSDSASTRALVMIPSSPLPRRERLEPLAVVQEGVGVAPGPSETPTAAARDRSSALPRRGRRQLRCPHPRLGVAAVPVAASSTLGTSSASGRRVAGRTPHPVSALGYGSRC